MGEVEGEVQVGSSTLVVVEEEGVGRRALVTSRMGRMTTIHELYLCKLTGNENVP